MARNSTSTLFCEKSAHNTTYNKSGKVVYVCIPFLKSVPLFFFYLSHDRVISDFDEGLLDVEPGTGLRQLLASKLQCEVMRVSKKFCGLESVGKRSFRPVRNQEARVRWVSVPGDVNLFLSVSISRIE